MSFHAFVIVNPASANGQTGKRWPELRAAIDRVLDRWDNEFTIGPGDATKLARRAVSEGYEMIVSVGGDGTMNEVVTGLFPEGPSPAAPTRKDVVLGSVRRGTGGDFARFLGLPGEIPECVAHLAGDNTRQTDLGIAEITSHDGSPSWRAFLNIASFGLSGLIDKKVNNTTKLLGGKASFAMGLVRALAEYRPQAVEVKVDGQLLYESTMIACAIANGQYFGGGMRFAPEAKIDDGLFEVVSVQTIGLKEVLSVADLYSGKITQWQATRTARGQRIEATPKAGAQVLLDIDGEQPGVLPATFRVVPSAARIKIP
jgi:YegS/Rv2252/BmrU family lipid kinase